MEERAGRNFWFEHIGNNHRFVTQVKGVWRGGSVLASYRSDGMIWNSQRGDGMGSNQIKISSVILNPLMVYSHCRISTPWICYYLSITTMRTPASRRGVIVQQIQKIDPCYVKVSKGVMINHPAILDESGNEIEPERIETI